MVGRVDVIMRSKNSDWVIGQALAGLFAQQGQPFGLVVVDSGSTDTTLEIVARHPHRLIAIERSEPSSNTPHVDGGRASRVARWIQLFFGTR